jgi:tetratricopeptide (TPR) repeat protein
MVEGGTGPNKNEPPGLLNDDGYDYYYQRDDEYEGDLHVTLGALYLSNDDLEKAMVYFENAISLYQINDSHSRRMADAKTNMAMALFRARQFQESIRVHTEALELYRALYGDGVNPLTQGLEDYEDLLGEPISQVLNGVVAGGKTYNGATTLEGGVAGGMHIDLGKYKQSLENATEAAAAPKATPKGTDEL